MGPVEFTVRKLAEIRPNWVEFALNRVMFVAVAEILPEAWKSFVNS